MLQIFYEDAPYAVLFKTDDLQAFRPDRWKNFERQPAETGPVLFTNTSPAYVQLQRVEGGGDSGGSNTGLIIGVAAAGVAVLAGVGLSVRSRRRGEDDDRE